MAGKTKPNPRYNVISCRVDDVTRCLILHACRHIPLARFLHEAVEEKLIAERQAAIDAITREAVNA